MSSGNVMTRKRFLCRWLFEDKLKTLYSQFISAVDAVSRDTVDMHRERAVTAMYKLLAGNPEQEVVSFLFSSLISMIQVGIRPQLQLSAVLPMWGKMFTGASCVHQLWFSEKNQSVKIIKQTQ